MADEEDLESLLARHKKEQKALVSQITSLKKTVTKGEKAKRKEVLLEVEQLEKGLRDRHQQELQQIKARGDVPKETTIPPAVSEREEESIQVDLLEGLQRLKLDEITTVGKKNTGGKTKMNRQAARLARREAEMEEQRRIAAEEATQMPDLSSLENAAMQKIFQKYDLEEENIRPDGNCLYAAFASQLNKTSSKKYDHRTLRSTAASFIKSNKEDFEPFLYADEYSSAKDIESYCKEIEETALWGGEMEITALARALDVPVEIYSNRSVTPMVIEPDSVKNEDTREKNQQIIRLAYYEYLYGLGQHYNSVFKADTRL